MMLQSPVFEKTACRQSNNALLSCTSQNKNLVKWNNTELQMYLVSLQFLRAAQSLHYLPE
jgi:hypothetical protein